LVEVLQLPSEAGSLQERLKDEEVQEGLGTLQALLRLGLDVDVQGGGVWQWSKQQVDCGLAIVESVLCASCDWTAGRWLRKDWLCSRLLGERVCVCDLV
jgi:hypothetical protein